MKTFSRTLVLTLILAASGCSLMAVKPNVAKEDLAAVKKIAIFSDLGNELRQGYAGETAFGMGTVKVEVRDWKIDSFAENEMITLLKSNAHYSLVASFPDETPRPSVNEITDRDAVLTRAKKIGFDAVIFLRPSQNDSIPQLKPGYGLFRRPGQTRIDRYVYFLATIAMYDTAHHKELGWTFSYDPKTQDPPILSRTPVQWRPHFENYSAAEKNQIEMLIKEKIKNAIAYSFRLLEI